MSVPRVGLRLPRGVSPTSCQNQSGIKKNPLFRSNSQRVLISQRSLQACCPLLSHFLAALGKPLRDPAGELHLPASFGDGGVLVGLELGVVVGELVVEDRDGHAVEDDAEGDAGEGEDAAQVGLREDVAVAHSGNTHLEETVDGSV